MPARGNSCRTFSAGVSTTCCIGSSSASDMEDKNTKRLVFRRKKAITRRCGRRDRQSFPPRRVTSAHVRNRAPSARSRSSIRHAPPNRGRRGRATKPASDGAPPSRARSSGARTSRGASQPRPRCAARRATASEEKSCAAYRAAANHRRGSCCKSARRHRSTGVDGGVSWRLHPKRPPATDGFGFTPKSFPECYGAPDR